MLKLNPNPTFRADVPLTVPGQEAAGTVNFTFRHMGRNAFKVWSEAASGKPDAESLTELIANWQGVTDDAGAPVAFSDIALAALLDAYPAAGLEIVQAYVKALTESRLGN